MPDETVLQVGVGKQYQTINAAIVAADKMGGNADIKVDAGTYTNDGGYLWDGINNVTVEGVGGMVNIVDPTYYAGGKAAIVTGGQNIVLKNLDISGVTVPDGNGAGVRYDQGTLLLDNVHLHDNQNGILGAPDITGSITIQNSEIDHNGTSAGNTHNIYIGDVGQFTLTNSYIHDANIGHEVKSRAENNTITNNRIEDSEGTSSYSIDLPNGGNATITGNVIEQGANGVNHIINAYGEEGSVHAGTAVTFSNNQVVNDNSLGMGPLWANNGATFTGTGNTLWNLTDLGNGVSASGFTQLSARPNPNTSVLTGGGTTPTPVAALPVATTVGLVLNLSEDAYQGDAQYTITVDGQQIGGTRTENVLHSSGQSENVALGSLSTGPHQIGVTFLNDKWDGTPTTDRNLFIDGATYDGQPITGSTLALMSAGTQTFTVIGAAAPAPTPVTTPVSSPAPAPVSVPTSGLVVNVSEDAYLGDAQFTIAVDGQQVGDTYTATASHNAGQSQAISVNTVLGNGTHTVGISFINDKWDGTPSTDRNLYVTGASYNGQNVPGAADTLMSNGTTNFGLTTGTQVTSTAVVVNISEDAYQGDAQFTIVVDGKQQGGTYTATASHGAGQSQAITLVGIAESFTPHDIAVMFLNDKYDGTPSTDRNLYVNSIQIDGQDVPGGAAALMSTGTQHFAAVAPANWVG